MKKVLFVFIGFMCIFNSVYAQDRVSSSNTSFSIGAELSLPVGVFGDLYSFGIGASGQGNFNIDNDLALTLYAGYINYSLKDIYGNGSTGYIPVLGGMEYSFSPKLFGSAQLGLTFYSGGGGSAFTYSPGIGIRLSRSINALLKYTAQSKNNATSGAVGIRASYNFGN